MAGKKKPIEAPLSRTAQLAARVAGLRTSTDLTSSWRYIDFVNPTARLPCLSLEWLFGSRGLLAGRILQLRATYSKGKSSFMYLEYAAAQAMSNAFCFHVETEGAASPADFIQSFGCNPDELLISEISALEECMSKIDEIIASIRGGFGGSIDPITGRQRATKYTEPLDKDLTCPIVMGIDSFSSLGLQAQVEEDVSDLTKSTGISQHTRKLREYLRNHVGRFRDTQTLLMMSSHETVKIESGKKAFGGPGKSALAQEAIGIHATYVVDVEAKPYVTGKEKGAINRIGDIIRFKTMKNKLSPRGRELELYLVWNQGFDLITTDVKFLLDHSASPLVQPDGTWLANRQNNGIKCPTLSDKVFKSDEDFLRAVYGNTDFVMSLRDKMRIRGCGFDFEKRYVGPAGTNQPTTLDGEDVDGEDPDGVAGSEKEV